MNVFTGMFSTFTWNGPNGSTSYGTTSPKDCFDIADPSVPRAAPDSCTVRSGNPSHGASQAQSKGSRGPEQKMVSDGLRVFVEERGHFRHRERHQVTESTVALLHFSNDFSLFYGHNLWGDCGESCTWATAENIALASISRYFPQSQNSHS